METGSKYDCINMYYKDLLLSAESNLRISSNYS